MNHHHTAGRPLYSNNNMNLLAAVLEHIENKSFYCLITDEMVRLGLRDTSLCHRDDEVPDKAQYVIAVVVAVVVTTSLLKLFKRFYRLSYH